MAGTRAEEFLSHTGVMGMHWGQRKDQSTGSRRVASKTSKNVKKFITNNKQDLIASGVLAGTALAIHVAAEHLLKHPEIMQRAANVVTNKKSIGIGYDVVTLAFKQGVWA